MLKKLITSLIIIFFTTNLSFAIKIGLINNARSSYVGVSKAGYAIDGHTGKTLFFLRPMHRYKVKKHRNYVAIKMEDGRYYNSGTNYLIVNSPNGFVSTKERWYRGSLIVQKRTGLTIINDVNMEGYILGVVPAEMPSSWNIEAHKAQAIAARSYAFANLGKRSSSGYDLKDTPEDQAYGGASAETAKTTKAVLDTKNKVLVYNHKIIPAYYHSSAGGKTRKASKAWGNKDLPYIHSVKSYDRKIAKNGHGVGMSQYGANYLAKKGYNCYQILNYFYKNIALGTVRTR